MSLPSPLHLPVRQFFKRIQFAPPWPSDDRIVAAVALHLDIGPSALEKWRNSVALEQQKQKVTLPTFVDDLGIVVSPFVTVKETSNNSKGFSLVARRPFPAGVFLASVPASSVMLQEEQEEPSSSSSSSSSSHDGATEDGGERKADGVSKFLDGVEQLSSQLLTSLVDDTAKFHSYATFLHDHVTPPKNLPFIVPGLRLKQKHLSSPSSSFSHDANSASAPSSSSAAYEPRSLLARALVSEFERRVVRYCTSVTSSSSSSSSSSDAQSETDHQHQNPLIGVPSHHLRWASSMVLSRRVGGSMLVPFVDFMNHSHRNSNAFYTMPASAASMTGLDLVDNIFAGVRTDRLLEPHLHVFSIRPVEKKFQEITMSYSDVDPVWVAHEDEQDNHDDADASKKSTKNTDALGAETRPLLDCGEDIWHLLYGFVPERRTDAPLRALQQVAEVVARSRLARRRELFPHPKEGQDGRAVAHGQSLIQS